MKPQQHLTPFSRGLYSFIFCTAATIMLFGIFELVTLPLHAGDPLVSPHALAKANHTDAAPVSLSEQPAEVAVTQTHAAGRAQLSRQLHRDKKSMHGKPRGHKPKKYRGWRSKALTKT